MPLALGNLIAGSIITLLTFLFEAYVDIIIYALFALAIIMLIVKNVRRSRKAHASDAKSHYTVTSRIAYKKKQPKVAKKVVKEEIEEELPEEIEETTEEVVEEVIEEVEETPAEEQTLDEYVYGEVQDFGDATETNKTKDEE